MSNDLTPAQKILKEHDALVADLRTAGTPKPKGRKLTAAEKAIRKAEGEKLPNAVVKQCELARLPAPVREYQIARDRQYRFDLAWPAYGLLVECQGGTWTKQRTGHSTGTGIERDAAKLNYAVCKGWRVLHITTSAIEGGAALAWIRQAIERTDNGKPDPFE